MNVRTSQSTEGFFEIIGVDKIFEIRVSELLCLRVSVHHLQESLVKRLSL